MGDLVDSSTHRIIGRASAPMHSLATNSIAAEQEGVPTLRGSFNIEAVSQQCSGASLQVGQNNVLGKVEVSVQVRLVENSFILSMGSVLQQTAQNASDIEKDR